MMDDGIDWSAYRQEHARRQAKDAQRRQAALDDARRAAYREAEDAARLARGGESLPALERMILRYAIDLVPWIGDY